MSTHRITKRRDIIKLLRVNGWRPSRRGKHEIWRHPNGRRPVALGHEWNGELPPGTIHQILGQIEDARKPVT